MRQDGVWTAGLRLVVVAATAFAALLVLGGAAGAHGGLTVSAKVAQNTPTLDGVFSPGEWSDSDTGKLTVSFKDRPDHPGTLYVKHDAAALYIALVVADSPPSPSGNCCAATFYFESDNDKVGGHDGVKEQNDDAVSVTAGSGSNNKNDLFWTGTAYQEDRKNGGSPDIEGRSAFDKSTKNMVIELRHPLCSGDTRDFCAHAGDTLGFTLDYFAAPGDYLGGFPAAPADAAHFADLLIEPVLPPDTTPPSVTLTEPAADVGVARGASVPLAATAVDAGSGVNRVRFDVSAAGGSNFKEVSTDTDAPYTGSLDTTGLAEGDYSVRAVAVDNAGNSATSATRTVSVTTSPVSVSGVTVATDKSTVEAGAKQIETAKIPLTAIPVGAGTTDSAPLASIPLASIPLASIPLASIPLASIPLASIGLTPAALNTYLGGLPLSSVPLVPPDSWSSRLVGSALAGVPEQTLTLAQVLALNPSPASGPTPIRLVDLAVVDSPLASIPLASIALGPLLLKDVPIGGGAATALADWCTAFAQAGFACTDPSSLASTTVMSATIAGAPLASIPLASIPLASIPLASIPLASIPLASIVALSAPLASIPLASIGAAARALLVDCNAYACATKTLGDARQDNALKTGVTLGDVAAGLPPEVTLGVVLAAISGQSASWESLPFARMGAQAFATDASRVTESVSFHLSGASVAVQARTPVTVSASIPPGALYLEGSAQLAGTTPLPDPVQTGNTLKWTLTLQRGADYRVDVKLGPSLTIGPAGPLTANVTAAASGDDDTADGGTVTDTFEPNQPPASPPLLAQGSVYTSYLTSAHDVDLYRFAVPNDAAGGRVVVHLTTPGKDYDLVVYRPGPLALRSAPLASIPLDGVPVGDDGIGVTHASDPLQPDTLQDVPLRDGATVASISANRGSSPETAQVEVRPGESGFYTIQVSGENGVFDNGYYALRIEVQKPAPQPACAPRSFANAPGAPGTAPPVSSLPSDLNTVFVVNRDRLQRTYGDAAAQSVTSALTSLAGRSDLGVVGAVLPVDTSAAGAMTTWDASPCSATLANAAAGAVSAAIETVRAARPSLKYVVLVGGDDQIPFFRTPDLTTLSNESEYASTLAGPNNEYLGSSLSGDLLTDNPYGTPAPIPFLDRFLYLPTLSVGRLVETPADIVKQAQTFQSFGGRLDPTSAKVTGYDFLSDGATGVANALVPKLGAPAVSRLINDTWTLGDLQGAVAAPTAGLLSLNAHYDHYRALPADQNASGNASQLFTTAMLAGSALDRRYAFTMGCHAGYSVSDIVIGATDARRLDWPQVYGAGAAVYAANTGFGYGDTATVAYSERLMVDLAKRLDGSLTAGQALLYALNDYAGSAGGLLGAYDEKVISEATFYGLPMYRVGAAAPLPPLPAPPATTTDPLTGLTISQLSVTPVQTLKTTTRGSFYAGEDGRTSVLNYRPVQPLTDLDVTQPSLVAHGALITGLTSLDQSGFNPVFSTPTADLAAREPEATFRDVVHPARIQSIATFADPRGPRQHLLLVTGQFASNATGPADVGRERLFTKIQAEVEYASPSATDFAPPTFGRISGAQVGDQAAFSVEASDSGGVKRVVVGYHDGSAWKFVDLRPDGDTWTGGAPTTTQGAEFFVQAVDASGNVALAVFKGRYYLVATPPPVPAGIVIGLSGTQGGGGWFTSTVDVLVSGSAGPFLVSIDGSAFGSTTAFALNGDGIHTIDVQGASGVTARRIVAIDTTPPTISITSPVDGASLPLGGPQTAAFSCIDRGSGIVSCEGSIANGGSLTGAFGLRTLKVTATDAAGLVAEKTVSFSVAWPFAGFFRPVDNPPAVNNVNAGQAIPIKFGLGGNRGLGILASGYPQAQLEPCPTGPTSTVDETVTAGQSGLSYSASSDRYTYVWKTDKKWAGSCRKLVLTLTDGSTRTADFRFK
jgi:Bacterial Ig domain